MMVISQDKKTLVNVSSIEKIYVSKFEIYTKTFSGDNVLLGEYSKAEVDKVFDNLTTRLTGGSNFQMPAKEQQLKLQDGDVLSGNLKNEIASNVKLSSHAIDRLKKRGVVISDVPNLIKRSKLAFYSNERFYIGINDYECFIVANDANGKYIIITFMEKSENGYTLQDKLDFAKRTA